MTAENSVWMGESLEISDHRVKKSRKMCKNADWHDLQKGNWGTLSLAKLHHFSLAWLAVVVDADWMTVWKFDLTSDLVLFLALAGSLGWHYRGNGCLVQSSRHFVDVVEGEQREYQTGEREQNESQHSTIWFEKGKKTSPQVHWLLSSSSSLLFLLFL